MLPPKNAVWLCCQNKLGEHQKQLFCEHHNIVQPLLLHKYNNYCYIYESTDAVRAFFFVPPVNYLRKSHAIFHIYFDILSIHTEVLNSTNKLNHVKWSAVFQNKPFALQDSRMNHLCRYWNNRMLSIVKITSCNCCACNHCAHWLPLINERFVIAKLVAISIVSFQTWCGKQCCQAWLHPSNRGQWFFKWGLFPCWDHCYKNQWSTTLMEAAIVAKCKHGQSHFDFLKKVSKKNSNWVSLFKEMTC